MSENEIQQLKMNMAQGIKNLENPHILVKLLRPPSPEDEQIVTWKIDGIIGHAKFELGDFNGYPHWHMNIQINHRTRIHIDREKFLEYLERVSKGLIKKEGCFFRSNIVPANMDSHYFWKEIYYKVTGNYGSFSLYTKLINVYDEHGELIPLMNTGQEQPIAIIEHLPPIPEKIPSPIPEPIVVIPPPERVDNTRERIGVKRPRQKDSALPAPKRGRRR